MDVTRPPQKLYPAEIYTSTFKLEGEIEPLGRLIDVLNDERRQYVVVRRVTMTPLHAASPMRTITVPEMSLNSLDVVFLSLKSAEDRAEIRLLPNIERIIAYTPLFILRANFHLGGEIRVRDMIDAMRATFFPITEVTLFPTFNPKAQLPSQYDFLIANKNFMHIYHIER